MKGEITTLANVYISNNPISNRLSMSGSPELQKVDESAAQAQDRGKSCRRCISEVFFLSAYWTHSCYISGLCTH